MRDGEVIGEGQNYTCPVVALPLCIDRHLHWTLLPEKSYRLYVFTDLIFYILISTRQIVALFKYTAMTQLLHLCFSNLVFKLLNVFLYFLSSLRSLNAGRTRRGAWGGKITLNKMALVTTLHDCVSNTQASTRVSTKYKPEMVSDFCNVPKSKRVRFKWMQEQKFSGFFSLHQLYYCGS